MVSDASAFDALAAEFFSVWFRFHPDLALGAGVADFARLLPAQSDDDLAALAGWLETLIVALEELDFDSLDQSRRVDLELMFALAAVEHRELLERDWRHRDPLRFLPLLEVHRLTLVRPRHLREALAALLGAIPDHLRQALSQLRPMAELVPPALVDAAIAAAADGRRYLRALARSRWLHDQCDGCAELETLAEAAGDALNSYAEGLREEIVPRAAGAAGCGAQHLDFLLRHRHLLQLGPDGCGPVLDAAAEECDRAMAGAQSARREPLEPAGDGPCSLGRERVSQACSLLAEHLRQARLVTLPDAPLHVAAGPIGPPGGPARVDYVADLPGVSGSLFVPDGARDEDVRFTAAEARAQCLGLGWGGLHLLTFAGGQAARSLPRRLAARATLAGGWGLYFAERLAAHDEALMPDPMALWRARLAAIAAARVDLMLHTGQCSVEEAAQRLAAAPMGSDPGAATAALAAIVQRPGDALARVLGWRLIECARGLALGAAGDGFDPCRFHDSLLSLGPIPLPLALRHAFGEPFQHAAEVAAWGQ